MAITNAQVLALISIILLVLAVLLAMPILNTVAMILLGLCWFVR